jgi:hypothetical protein
VKAEVKQWSVKLRTEGAVGVAAVEAELEDGKRRALLCYRHGRKEAPSGVTSLVRGVKGKGKGNRPGARVGTAAQHAAESDFDRTMGGVHA